MISIDPQRISGTPCFVHTRVPLQALWDHITEGPGMEEFLEGFPSVTREQAVRTLEMALERLLEGLPLQEEQTRRVQVLMEANRQYAALREDAAAWQEELAERAIWEGTLLDDLEEETSLALAPSHNNVKAGQQDKAG